MGGPTPTKSLEIRERHLRLGDVNQLNEHVINLLTEDVDEDFAEALENSSKALAIAERDEIDSNFTGILKYNEACCYQCMNNLSDCRNSLRDAIKCTKIKLRQIKQASNESFEINFPLETDIHIES